jgi:hypothetical protein
MLNVIMLSVVMLNVVMLSFVVPTHTHTHALITIKKITIKNKLSNLSKPIEFLPVK